MSNPTRWKIDRPLTDDETQEFLAAWRRRFDAARGAEKVESAQERNDALTLLDRVAAAKREGLPRWHFSPWHATSFEDAIRLAHPDALPLIERVLEETDAGTKLGRHREARALLNKVAKRSA